MEGDSMYREDSIDLAKKRKHNSLSLESLSVSQSADDEFIERGCTRLRTKVFKESCTGVESRTPRPRAGISRVQSELAKACRSASGQIDRLIDDNPVILFSQTNCMKSRDAWSALAESAILFMVVEVEELLVGDVAEYQDYLSEKTGIPGGLPCLFIQGRSTGDSDDIVALCASGELAAMCSQAGAPEPELKMCRSTSLKSLQRRARRQNSRQLAEAAEASKPRRMHSRQRTPKSVASL